MNNQPNALRLLSQLFRELKAFGLNPADWTIDHSSDITRPELSLVHRNDRDFQLLATLKREVNSGLKIESLVVVSI